MKCLLFSKPFAFIFYIYNTRTFIYVLKGHCLVRCFVHVWTFVSLDSIFLASFFYDMNDLLFEKLVSSNKLF